MAENSFPVIAAAVFDTKPYDRQALQQASADYGIEWHFHEFRLTEDSASAAKNARDPSLRDHISGRQTNMGTELRRRFRSHSRGGARRAHLHRLDPPHVHSVVTDGAVG